MWRTSSTRAPGSTSKSWPARPRLCWRARGPVEMRALLIAPAERPHVTALWEVSPLANLPILGKCLIEYWLEHLAASGAKKVSILAADRPEQVRRLVGDGARWGLDVEVVPECRELTPDEARGKYLVNGGGDWLPAPNDARVMDHLPESPGHPLFASY